jgi:flagellar protein FliO/FliZ
MRPLFSVPLVFAFPISGRAAEIQGETGGFSLLSSTIQMLASLALVIGIILIFHYLSKRWTKSNFIGKSLPRYIRLVESRFLAPKKSLILVEVAGEYLLLSCCGENLNFIKQIEMIEDIEIVGEIPPVPLREAFQEKIKSLTARIPSGAGVFCGMTKKGGLHS